MNECSVSTVSKLIQICWQSFSETDTESRLHWSNQMVGNWNVQRAEISNLSENNLVTALSLDRLTLLELVMSRSHQSSWKILFDGSTRIKPVYGTLNSRNFWYSTVFFSYPPNWTKLDLTFILNNYQSFRSNCSLISGVSQDTETFKTGKEVKEWKWEWRKNCPHFHFETRQNFTIGKNNVWNNWILQFCSSRLCSSTAPQSRKNKEA